MNPEQSSIRGVLSAQLISINPFVPHPRAKIWHFVSGKRWDEIRYQWEQHLRDMQVRKRSTRKPRKIREYLIGYNNITGEIFEDDEVLNAGQCVRLRRMPMLPHHRDYKPEYLEQMENMEDHFETQNSNFHENTRISEDEKKRMIELMCRPFGGYKSGKSCHATWIDKRVVSDIGSAYCQPKKCYVCRQCGENGTHWTWECNKQGKAVTKRLRPHGIPKSQLRVAKTEEERKSAMIDEDGEYVIRITRMISQY